MLPCLAMRLAIASSDLRQIRVVPRITYTRPYVGRVFLLEEFPRVEVKA